MTKLIPYMDVAGAARQTDSLVASDEPLLRGSVVQAGGSASLAASIVGLQLVTGLAGLTEDSQGRYLTTSGVSSSFNEGNYLIVEVVSSSSCKIDNPAGVIDTNNGSISWEEREDYTLEDDINYARSDRKSIKGTTTFADAIPVFQRPTAVGVNIPANLTNLAGKTTDAKAFIFARRFLNASVLEGASSVTLSDVGNFKHATSMDRTGVPVIDGADAGDFESTNVDIIDSSALHYLEAIGKSVGTIVVASGSLIVDGETFTISDGTNAPVTFEFDSNSSVTQSPTLRSIVYTSLFTVSQIRDAVIKAVLDTPTLYIYAKPIGLNVDLVNEVSGIHGNVPITHTMSSPLFQVTGMSGGTTQAGSKVIGRSKAGSSVPPNSVDVDLLAMPAGGGLVDATPYVWERNQPNVIDLFYSYRERTDLAIETSPRQAPIADVRPPDNNDFFTEFFYALGKLVQSVVWETSSRIKKLEESFFSYTGANMTKAVKTTYDSEGVFLYTETKTFTYSGGSITTVVTVRTE